MVLSSREHVLNLESYWRGLSPLPQLYLDPPVHMNTTFILFILFIEVYNISDCRGTLDHIRSETSFERIESLGFSTKGRTLASATESGCISLWDVRTCRLLVTIKHGCGPIEAMTFSSSGQLLAWASRNHIVKVLDVDSRKVI